MRSITFRLTLLFASVSTTVLLLLGLLIGSLVEHHIEELDMELLEGKLELQPSRPSRKTATLSSSAPWLSIRAARTAQSLAKLIDEFGPIRILKQ